MRNYTSEKRNRLLLIIEELKKNVNNEELELGLRELKYEIENTKYGLRWEEHEERVDTDIVGNILAFNEVPDYEINLIKGDHYNFLLEGDNLHSLKILEKTHLKRIDLIYIDPPYNTKKKDFMYDDKYIDLEDIFKHSLWLSFMKERLSVARNLLTEEGVILIQIDDKELAQLKLLCDEIFGEENFINVICVNMKNIAGASGGGEDKRFKKNVEYILIYAKSYADMPKFKSVYDFRELEALLDEYEENEVSWKYTSILVDPGEKVFFQTALDGDGNDINIYLRSNPKYDTIPNIMRIENLSRKEAYLKYYKKIFTTTMPQSSIRTRVLDKISGEENLPDLISIEYVPKSGKNKDRLYEQFYKGEQLRLFAWFRDVVVLKDGDLFKKEMQGTYWNFAGATKNLSKEGNIQFKNGKKPLELLKKIVQMYDNDEAIVLDFFAGSGTTGHAVIEANQEDGGKRKFILCTNNENQICETITLTRLQNVINGYTTLKGKTKPAMPANLKYYRSVLVPKNSEDAEIIDILSQYTKSLVQLEHFIDYDATKHIIVNSDDELDDLFESESINNCEFLYISSTVLLTNKQEKKLKSLGIKLFTIPEYYYLNELREVGEI